MGRGRTTDGPELTSRFDEALRYASAVHRDQRRKSTQTPYVAHLLEVCASVLADGGDEDEAIAALLHDAVEDQGGPARRADIEARFGGRVAAIVDACTDTDQDPKPPWDERKRAYLEHLRAEERTAVLRVSAADKLANARAIVSDLRHTGDGVWSRFNAGRDGQLWYYGELVDAFGRRFPDSPLTAELARVVGEMRQLAGV